MALPVLLLFFVVGVSVCVAFSLRGQNPPHVHSQSPLISPWKPSLTDYGVCLRRRPVLHSASTPLPTLQVAAALLGASEGRISTSAREGANPLVHPGDALVFDGTLCHKGARQAREVGHASVAAHAYVGRELADLADSFGCLSGCEVYREEVRRLHFGFGAYFSVPTLLPLLYSFVSFFSPREEDGMLV